MAMPESNSTFDGTFEDEESSSSEVSSSGDEDSVEESSEEEVPMSKSEIPFDKKVKMFDSGGKMKSSSESDENFDDESGSDSGSEYSGEEDYSEEGSSGSEESSHGDKDGQESFLNEQERLRGMGSISSSNPRKWLFIGLGICCVVILALSIGLGVGLTRNKDDEPEDGVPAPASVPTFAPGMAPTNAPVRLSVKLPNYGSFVDSNLVTDDVVIDVESDKATTIYRDGELSETTNGDLGTLLVQGGDPENAELPSAFALVELPLTSEDLSYLQSDAVESVNFCLEHFPNSTIPDRTVTYSACLIKEGAPSEGVDTLTGLTASYLMPDDCIGQSLVTFDVSPTDTEVCVDVSNMDFDSLNRRALRKLRGHRALEESGIQSLLMMIDNLEPSNQTGDRFYNEENKQPSLIIEGTLGCKNAYDIICSDEQFSTLCTLATAIGLDKYGIPDMTFFAPTNDAIEKFLATGKEINDIDLNNHFVIDSQIKSSDIDCSLSELPPLLMDWSDITTNVTCDSGSIFIAGGGNTGDLIPKVVEADIQSCDTVVHAIDYVILEGDSGDEDGAECKSFEDVLCSRAELAALCTFAELFASDPLIGAIFNTLSSTDGTLFLPDNEAALALTTISQDTQQIYDLLLNHFVVGLELGANDLVCDGVLQMQNGASTTTMCVGDDKFQVGDGNVDPFPKIVATDIETCSVLIHIIDGAILTVDGN